MNIRNHMNVSLSAENVVLMASVLLKVAENSLASFPLQDLTNLNCWMASILSQPAEGSPILRGIGLTDHSFSIGNFSMDVSCVSCTSPDFDELLLSLYLYSWE